jgi:hypothetical protein
VLCARKTPLLLLLGSSIDRLVAGESSSSLAHLVHFEARLCPLEEDGVLAHRLDDTLSVVPTDRSEKLQGRRTRC